MLFPLMSDGSGQQGPEQGQLGSGILGRNESGFTAPASLAVQKQQPALTSSSFPSKFCGKATIGV